MCLFKLFKIEFAEFSSLEEINNFLHKKFGIYSFQHRIFSRISILSFKLFNFLKSPKILQDIIVKNYVKHQAENLDELNYKTLRNGKRIINTEVNTVSKYAHSTFKFFSDQIIVAIGIDAFSLNLNEFKKLISSNINYIFSYFSLKFCKFNLINKTFIWTKPEI